MGDSRRRPRPAPTPAACDAIITLGCLLRGETAHYEAIYNEVARGIGQSQQETGIPHSFGVLTCETLEQALEPRRHQGRQQGLRGRRCGHRDGEPARQTCSKAAPLDQRAHRRKSRELAMQMLFQADIGKQTRPGARHLLEGRR